MKMSYPAPCGWTGPQPAQPTLASLGAVGVNAYAVRIGANTPPNLQTGSIAIGANAGANAASISTPGSIAIGQRSVIRSEAIAIGRDAQANGTGNTTIGHGARSGGDGSITIGGGADNATNNNGAWGNILIGKHGRNTHTGAAVISPRTSTVSPTSRANNQMVLGSPGTSAVGFSAWSNVSDQRDKTEIQPLTYDPVQFIKGLKPRQYKYDMRQSYRHIKEITEPELNTLSEYEKQHRIISMPVFGLKTNSDDGTESEIIPGFEWIEEYPYLGIAPKVEDPTCLENCIGGKPFNALTLGEIPKFSTLNEFAETPSAVRGKPPILKGRFYRDYFEALAAWKLSKCPNSEELTTLVASLPFMSKLDPEKIQVRTAYFHIVESSPDGTHAGKRLHNGFIAQEVEALASQMGFDFAGVQHFAHHKGENGVALGDDAYALANEEMTAPIVAVLQTLLDKCEQQEQRIKELESR